MCAAIALHIALTIDLAGIGIGKKEIARVSVVSLDKDKAEAVMEHLMGALEREGGALRGHLVRKDPKPTSSRIRIRREDGRQVDIVVAAGKRGGGSLVSRWTVCAIFDEACRMQGSGDGIVNFDDMRRAVIGRLTLAKGAQLVVVSSPWAARGPVYDAVQEHWGKPTERIVLLRATGPEMNPVLWTPEACAAALVQDEAAYQTDVLGEFVDAESSFFSSAELRSAKRAAPFFRSREDGIQYGAAIDAATRSNAWTLVIAGKELGETPPDDKYHIARCQQWQGSKLKPLKAKEVFAEIKPILEAYGLTALLADQWSFDVLSEHATDAGIMLELDESKSDEKSKQWLSFRTRLVAGKLELAPEPVLLSDLLSVVKKLTPEGIKFEYPLTRDGRHADFAPAAKLAVEVACQGASWVDAMAKLQARGGVLF